jgi:hypothetical protein
METTQRREVNDKEFVYANQIAEDIIVATIVGRLNRSQEIES